MKVNLLNDQNTLRSDAMNIDPFADPSDPSKTFGGFENLDLHVDDGEVNELFAHDIVDYLQKRDLEPIIDGWVRKLALNGRITIGGVDIHELSKGTINGVIDIAAINELLYEDHRHKQRKSVFSISNMVDLLQKRGLKILHKRLNGFRYVVVAERVQ